MSELLAWSHSRRKDYVKCPRMFQHRYILKTFPYVQSPQAARGEAYHSALERRVRSGVPLPAEMAQHEPMAASLVRAAGQTYCEYEMAVDKHLAPCGYKDWTNAWCRADTDILKVGEKSAFAGDYKTGKVSRDEDQLKLNALLLFAHMPDLERVTTAYFWLDYNVPPSTKTYYRQEVTYLWETLMPEVREMQESYVRDHYPAKPSKFGCGYCDVNKRGLCDKAMVRYQGD